MMQRAENSNNVEEVKQRKLRAILNNLTPHNFVTLTERVKAVHINNAVTLAGFVLQIFDKALMEPNLCELYASFCFHLSTELPDFTENDKRITFRRLLLNNCQMEFERDQREEANLVADEEREEQRIKSRRRRLGNIRLIAELYKKRMLTERIIHECIQKLFHEEDIEALCMLMSTVGEMIDHPKAKEHMDAYFERMKLLSNMLKDVIDLRNNKWQQKESSPAAKPIVLLLLLACCFTFFCWMV